MVQLSRRTKLGIIAALVIVVLLVVIKIFFFSGRSASRLLGENFRQVIKVKNLPDVNSVLSISFDRRGSETVKDVTFMASDGYMYTKEYKDWSPLEGVIRWRPHGQGKDFVQSRALSRWIGDIVNLELPENFQKLVNVDISYNSKGERVKNLVYLSKEGRLMAKEYKEGLVDRHFGGHLEIKPKK